MTHPNLPGETGLTTEFFADCVCSWLTAASNAFSVPVDGMVTLVIVLGSCVLQRCIANQWLDMQAFHREGILVAGMTGNFRICGSGVSAVAVTVPQDIVTQHLPHLRARVAVGGPLCLPSDVVVGSLVRAWAASRSESDSTPIDHPIIDALLRRVSSLTAGMEDVAPAIDRCLPAWRLRRVAEMVNANIFSNITLADMATTAGLSPMYFAAQFKKATGMRPHQYILAKRIEHAKELLRTSESSMLDVALSVGFRTQAHFATIFKQHVMVTPTTWRRQLRAA